MIWHEWGVANELLLQILEYGVARLSQCRNNYYKIVLLHTLLCDVGVYKKENTELESSFARIPRNRRSILFWSINLVNFGNKSKHTCGLGVGGGSGCGFLWCRQMNLLFEIKLFYFLSHAILVLKMKVTYM